MTRVPSAIMVRRALVNCGAKAARRRLIAQGYDAPSLNALEHIRSKMVERGEARRLALTSTQQASALEDTVIPAILAAFSQAAEEGRKCPTNPELAPIARRAVSNISKHVARLEARGAIEIRQKASARAVKIVATGKTTAGWDTMFDPPALKHEPRVVVTLPPLSLRVPCPYCGCRLDADPSLCCARGREMRKMAA